MASSFINNQPVPTLVTSKRSVDIYGMPLYTSGQVEQPMIFDNLIDITGILEGEANMPIIRRRVIIDWDDDGKPIIKNLKANSEYEMNDKIVQAYVKYGRINEFMNAPTVQRYGAKKHNFREFTEHWLERRSGGSKRYNTLRSDKMTINAHLLPVFGDMNIEDITEDDVYKWLQKEKENGTAKASAALYIRKLRQIIKAAIKAEIITKDPMADVENLCTGKREKVTLTEEQIMDILHNVEKLKYEEDRYMILLLMFAGTRRGETMALKWEDINFKTKRIHVQRNEVYNDIVEIGETKNESSNRELDMDDILYYMLLPNQERKGFIIGGEKPITKGTFDYRYKRIQKTVNLYGATPHAFRRSLLTLMNEKGISITDIQAFAGHKNVLTTLQEYIQPSRSGMKRAGSVISTSVKEKLVKNEMNMNTEKEMDMQRIIQGCTQSCARYKGGKSA